MQNLIKIYVLSIILFSLTACGGGKTASSTVSGFNTANSITTISSSGNESVQKLTDYTSYSVASIVNCGQGIVTNVKTVSLFGDYDGKVQNKSLSDLNFSGWNHSTNGNIAEWTNLKLTGSSYSFDNNIKANSSCNNLNTIDIVLLKKIADWNHQHSNGFECNILARGHKFGDIENLVFDLKINSAKTKIPSVESLKATYANYVNDSIVDALEDGKVNIGITLGDNTNLNASIIIQLDQKILSDKWVRVTIPMDQLSFYQEINYKHTSKTQADLNNIIINRILIVGETKSGSVLRGKINNWNANVPETFKEMDLSFKKIEFQLK
ncbi:hypothetical protein [Flavobacterium sp. 5]|uniref:hypothetical protein n=1 Tax=Flavobacterium sp. 5 TaxID=2035199 RepID=UPI000C2C75FD|nr:hypothetical protein [Flavobacterium sp. 5]PKB17912.1 hypothetical protein CLU82_3163 [Flavobacterium sp. 5]